MSLEHSRPDQDEWIWGAAAIAPLINQTRRQTEHLLQTGRLPAAKLNSKWCTTRRKLREYVDRVMNTGDQHAA